VNTLRRSLAALLAVCSAFAAQAALAQQKTDAAARQLFEAVNRERVSQGSAKLKWDDALASAARQHAEAMAARNTLGHQLPDEPSLPTRATRAGVRFVWLSENVAQGPSAANISEQWAHSPNHRANVLDTDMDTVGIGVAERNGVLFAVADFCKVKH
jgi:uncharacterized protein YkwD